MRGAIEGKSEMKRLGILHTARGEEACGEERVRRRRGHAQSNRHIKRCVPHRRIYQQGFLFGAIHIQKQCWTRAGVIDGAARGAGHGGVNGLAARHGASWGKKSRIPEPEVGRLDGRRIGEPGNLEGHEGHWWRTGIIYNQAGNKKQTSTRQSFPSTFTRLKQPPSIKSPPLVRTCTDKAMSILLRYLDYVGISSTHTRKAADVETAN